MLHRKGRLFGNFQIYCYDHRMFENGFARLKRPFFVGLTRGPCQKVVSHLISYQCNIRTLTFGKNIYLWFILYTDCFNSTFIHN